jgi:hypothetical protein
MIFADSSISRTGSPLIADAAGHHVAEDDPGDAVAAAMGPRFDRAVAADDSEIEARRLQIYFRRATDRSSARASFPWVARGAVRLARRQACFRATGRFSSHANDRWAAKVADCSALPADDWPEAVASDHLENAGRRRRRICFRATVQFSFHANDRLVAKVADCSVLPADDWTEAVASDRSENAACRRCRICFRAAVHFFARANRPWVGRGAGRRARRVADCSAVAAIYHLENEARAPIYLRATSDRFAHATALAGVQAGVCSAIPAQSCAALQSAGD